MPVENIIINKVGDDHVLDLQSISVRTFSETFATHNSEENMELFLNEKMSVKQLTDELLNEVSEFYFAFTEDQLAGYLKINFGNVDKKISSKYSLEIERIYVLKKFQSRKIGYELYQKAVSRAKELSAEYTWLGVWEKNTKAISFYKKLGFKEFGAQKFKLGNDIQNDVLMKVVLI